MIYKKKQLLPPLIIETYSLSARTLKPFWEISSQSNNPAVFTQDPAGHENHIDIFIVVFTKNKNIAFLVFKKLVLKSKKRKYIEWQNEA
ncbi:MAG TPA: hypothetical protein PKH20_08290 [Exilispira sp.]|nr:hypothetical protein [Exilispira sp.]